MKLVKKNCNGDGEILLFSFEWAFLSLHISPVIQVVYQQINMRDSHQLTRIEEG